MISMILDENSLPKDDSLLRIKKISEMSGIDHIAVLPEVHYKKTYSAPTGVVYVSKNLILPQLIALVINCGMRIVTTPLNVKDMNENTIDKIYRNLMKRISIKQPQGYVLNDDRVIDIMLRGSTWAVENLQLDVSQLYYIENQGNMFG